MFQIKIDEIDSIIPLLLSILGESFVKEELEVFSKKTLTMGEDNLLREKSHPLASWWDSLQRDIERSKTRGAFLLSEEGSRTLSLLEYLLTIKGQPNSERIIDRIRNKDTFASAFFEARVYSGYAGSGVKLKIVEEKDSSGVRTPDFVTIDTTHLVHIECKSLDDKLVAENVYHRQIMRTCLGILKKRKRNWFIRIFLGKDIDHDDADLIKTCIERDACENDLSTKVLDRDRVVIEYARLAEVDETLNMPVECHNLGPEASSEITAWVGSDGAGYCKNPRIVTLYPYSKNRISDRVKALIRKACRQIPSSGPGVLHIDLPRSLGKDFLEVVDQNYDEIFEHLNRETTRLNAVVLHTSVFRANQNPPWVDYFSIIPNVSAANSIPKDFCIFGINRKEEYIGNDDSNSEVINDDRYFCYNNGVFRATLDLDRDLAFGEYVLLTTQATHDGKKQLSLYYSWDKSLRLERFTPQSKRQVLVCANYEILKGQPVLIHALWTIERMALARNREKLIEKRY